MDPYQEQLKILTLDGREIYSGVDYMPKLKRSDTLDIAATQESFRVLSVPLFRKGKDRTAIVKNI